MGALAALLLSACGAEAVPTPAATSSQLQAQVVATEIVVGDQQRVPIGITDHNTPVFPLSTKDRTWTVASLTGVLWSVMPIGTRCWLPTTISVATTCACRGELVAAGVGAASAPQALSRRATTATAGFTGIGRVR